MQWLALVAALALTAAACGSTVQQSGQGRLSGSASAGESSLDGSGSGAAGAADELGGGSTASGGGTSGGNRTTSRSGSTGTQSGGSRTGSGNTSSSGLGPGISATTINVGILYAVNSGAANAAIGAAGISQGDEKKNNQIIIDDINAHGGVAGRKLVPIYHSLDATSSETIDNQYQAACDDLTQDHKVFIAFAGNNEVWLQCIQNRGVIALTSNLTIADAAVFKRFPNYLELNSLNLDRIAAAEVPALNAQGYFSGWNAAAGQPAPTKAKVGVVTIDHPAFAHATDQVLVPALAKIGYAPDPADVVRVPYIKQTSDTGSAAAAVSGAVLKLRSDGVTHVLILEASATVSLLFGNNADSQHYYPRYGANSQTGQQALVESGAYPKSQLAGTIGIGWEPSLDISTTENTPNGPYSNDLQRQCTALYKAHGVTFADQNAAAVGYLNCNDMWFFRDVMNKTKVLTRDGFMAVVNNLGLFKSLTVFPTKLDAAHHDAIAAVRYWVYKPECGCMRYASGDIPA